jgi:hypothetical protein
MQQLHYHSAVKGTLYTCAQGALASSISLPLTSTLPRLFAAAGNILAIRQSNSAHDVDVVYLFVPTALNLEGAHPLPFPLDHSPIDGLFPLAALRSSSVNLSKVWHYPSKSDRQKTTKRVQEVDSPAAAAIRKSVLNKASRQPFCTIPLNTLPLPLQTVINNAEVFEYEVGTSLGTASAHALKNVLSIPTHAAALTSSISDSVKQQLFAKAGIFSPPSSVKREKLVFVLALDPVERDGTGQSFPLLLAGGEDPMLLTPSAVDDKGWSYLDINFDPSPAGKDSCQATRQVQLGSKGGCVSLFLPSLSFS